MLIAWVIHFWRSLKQAFSAKPQIVYKRLKYGSLVSGTVIDHKFVALAQTPDDHMSMWLVSWSNKTEWIPTHRFQYDAKYDRWISDDNA